MDTIDLTKMTPLRRMTREYTSTELETALKHLTKLKNEKVKEETKLQELVNERERARLEAVESLKAGGIPIPLELSREITLEGELRKRREARQQKIIESTKQAIIENSVDN